MEEKELQPQKRISPTSINTWFLCPRKYYNQYILKLKVKPSIHMTKGSIVHKVLEIFYKSYNPNPKVYLNGLFETNWDNNKKLFDSLELSKEELEHHKQDALFIVNDYYEVHNRKIKMLVLSGKVENERHAFYLIRPKFRELWVEDKELHCGGYIDRVYTDFNGVITIGDYKTSFKYGIGISDDYRRQTSIYGLLYNNKTGVMPNFVSVIFLRYGEEFSLEVTPNLLAYARNTIGEVWRRTRSVVKEDYPLCESNLCSWCDFRHNCSGKADFDKKKRLEGFKEIIKDDIK